MEIGAIIAAEDLCQITKQFDMVGHEEVGDHSSMDRRTTLVDRPVNFD